VRRHLSQAYKKRPLKKETAGFVRAERRRKSVIVVCAGRKKKKCPSRRKKEGNELRKRAASSALFRVWGGERATCLRPFKEGKKERRPVRIHHG